MPEKTKHCKLCEGCVNGFDHHCMWVDNCVGYKNHRIFVLFALFLWTENYLFVQEAYSCELDTYVSKVACHVCWSISRTGVYRSHPPKRVC